MTNKVMESFHIIQEPQTFQLFIGTLCGPEWELHPLLFKNQALSAETAHTHLIHLSPQWSPLTTAQRT